MLAGSLLCSTLALVGAIWIAVVAFQNGDIAMGVFSIFCFIVTIVYGIQNIDSCKVPLVLLVIGVIGRIVIRFGMASGGAI